MPSKTKLKLCGYTNQKDLEKSLGYNIAYVGFVFVEDSPRAISLKDFKHISQEVFDKLRVKEIQPVAVFKNPTFNQVSEVISTNRVDVIQFHGFERIDLIKKIKKKIS